MPIYEYDCQGCRSSVEVLVFGSQHPQCPSCGSNKLERKLSLVAHSTGKNRQLDQPTGSCGRPQCGMYGCQGMQ